MYKGFLLVLLASAQQIFGHIDEITKTGAWVGRDVIADHFRDTGLEEALVTFFRLQNVKSIVDFGCGKGDYIKRLHAEGFKVKGFDGNPFTAELTDGLGSQRDLTTYINLPEKPDWIMSLEVGEHIPKQFEKKFINNLIRNAKKGIVLSWAIKGQGGAGHFNEQNNDYIKAILAKRGLVNDIEAENFLRKSAYIGWFRNTVMVFRKAE